MIGPCGIDGCEHTHLPPEAATVGTLDEGRGGSAEVRQDRKPVDDYRTSAPRRASKRIVPDEDAMRNREILTIADIQRERLRAARTNDIPGRASTLQLAVIIRVRRAQRDFPRARRSA